MKEESDPALSLQEGARVHNSQPFYVGQTVFLVSSQKKYHTHVEWREMSRDGSIPREWSYI